MENTIDIFGYIGEDIFFGGVNVATVSEQLNAIKGNEVIVRINSGGGSVTEGNAIYQLLKASGKKVTVQIIGQAYSIASVIAMAGEKILIGEFATMMVHPAWVGMEGNADELRETADTLDMLSENMFEAYLTRETVKQNETELRGLFKDQKIISAKDCIRLGLADDYLADAKAKLRELKMNIPLKAVAYISQTSIENKMEKQIDEKLKGHFDGLKKFFTDTFGKFKIKPQGASFKTDDGKEYWCDGESIDSGSSVFTDAEMTKPASDGDYTVGGIIYKVKDGKVTEVIKPADESDTEKLQAQLNAEKLRADNAEKELGELKIAVGKYQEKFTELENTVLGTENNPAKIHGKEKVKEPVAFEKLPAYKQHLMIKNGEV